MSPAAIGLDEGGDAVINVEGDVNASFEEVETDQGELRFPCWFELTAARYGAADHRKSSLRRLDVSRAPKVLFPNPGASQYYSKHNAAVFLYAFAVICWRTESSDQ